MMHKAFIPQGGALYSCDANGNYICLDEDFTLPNGALLSLDNTELYVCESRPNWVYAYNYNIETGKATNRRILKEVLGCDGMCMDENGNLWIAQCSQGCVVCIDFKTGLVLEIIQFPIKNVTACAFGGKNLDILYVTGATFGNKNLPEDTGSLYSVEGIGVRGKKISCFK